MSTPERGIAAEEDDRTVKLMAAGMDRTGDLGEAIRREAAEAARNRAPWSPFGEAHSALTLRATRDERDYLRQYLYLLSFRHGIMLEPGPRRPDATAWRRLTQPIRAFLKRWLTYQHARIVLQQSAINEMGATAMEFERLALRREVDELRARVARLESAAGDPR